MSEKKILPDALDTEKLKKMYEDIPDQSPGTFSLEEILAEFKYDDTVNVKLTKPQTQQVADEGARAFDVVRVSAQHAEKQSSLSTENSPQGLQPPEEPEMQPQDAAEEGSCTVFEKSFNMGLEEAEAQEAPEDIENIPEDAPEREFFFDSPQEEPEPEADSEAEFTPDTPPGEAARALAQTLKSLQMRTGAAFFLCLCLTYLTFAHRYAWPLPAFAEYIRAPYIYLFIMAFLLLGVMLCGADVFVAGLRGLIKLKPGAEALAAVSCVSSLLHTLTVMAFPGWGGYLPYCAVAAGSLFFAMWGRCLRLSAMRIGCKTACSTTSHYLVEAGVPVFADMDGCVKYESTGTKGFVSRCEMPDNMRALARYLVPLTIIACLVFAGLASFGRHAPERFFWAWAAISAPAAAFPVFFSFSLPYHTVSRRLFMSGAAIAGWPGAKAVSRCRAVTLGDSDLFPPGTISLNGLKVLGGHSVERVIACTASVVAASGSGLSRVFATLLHEQSASISQVENFQHYEGGGMGADIGGSRVLVGSANFMLRMGIKPPKSVHTNDVILTAINQEPAAVFALNYTVQPGIRRALNLLIRHKLVPVFATRDFNITPSMFSLKFKISSDVPEYPPIEEKLALSDPMRPEPEQPDAVICREGLSVYADCVLLGRRLHSVSRANALIAVAGLAFGVLIMFYLTYTGSFAAASPGNVMVHMALWALSCLLISFGVDRY